MRLLYLSADPGIPVFGHKGASVHVRELVTALAAEGASVTIASPRVDPEGDWLDARAKLVRIRPIVAKAYDSRAALCAAIDLQARQVTAIAARLGSTAIYERYSLHSRAGADAAEALDLPYVLEVNAPLRDETRRFRSLAHPEVAAETEARAYARADRIFAVSTPLATLLRGEGIEPDRLEVMRNAVTPAKFPARRTRTGFTIGFAGSLKPWHGLDVLTDAVDKAATAVPDLRLEVIGDGPVADVLDQLALPPERFIRYGATPHAETLRLLTSWDVGVAPYVAGSPTFYFSPLKVVEYMAAGACPVASDLGDIRSLLGDGERGVLVPPGDRAALGSVLVDLATDRPRAAALGARAQAYAVRSLSWQRNARRAMTCLQSARPGTANA